MSAVGMQGIAVTSVTYGGFVCRDVYCTFGDHVTRRQASKHTTVIDDSDGVEMEIQTKRQSAGKCLTGTRRGRSGK